MLWHFSHVFISVLKCNNASERYFVLSDGFCQHIYTKLQKDTIKYSAFKLRIFNEISTIILFAVVFLVTLKSAINWIWGVVGIILFGVLMMLGIKLYKRIREKSDWEKTEKEVLNSINSKKEIEKNIH